jgi:LuxR family maltose regulon positive regulatory protein
LDAITLTKLQRPRVSRRLIARPQVLEQLDAAQSLMLAIAPAGGGKTTLLSTWLETCNMPHAWLSLDERDNDLGLFATYLIRALRALFPVVDSTLVEKLCVSSCYFFDGARAGRLNLRRGVRAFMSAFSV